ncbi:MAG: Bax inhibitor-1 family protein [Kofleriaceae bacterium]|nr:Bax inhibitor-1 family protein [Kofleriaceae bacterium]
MFQQAQQHVRPIRGAVATAGVSERVTFIRKTYAHLVGAILAFVALEYALLDTTGPLFETVTIPFVNAVTANWWMMLVMFMGAGWIANKWAHSNTSRGIQYLGLALYIVAEAFVMLPLLAMASLYHEGVIADAGILTLFLFTGLTVTVFMTKKDFSFMRGMLVTAAFGAMGVIAASMLFGFTLGTLFTGFMIMLASGYVLYYTSAVLHHYRPTQYVAASLALFSAIALMFYYILMFVMRLTSD